MALSKPRFLAHLRALSRSHHRLSPSPSFSSFRFLSFASPEEAAAERRRRKRRIGIPYFPFSAFRPQSPQNPNAPKLPESVSALTGNRLNLHNRILTLILQNDLEEAALFTRHSIYSNCRPTIFTVNAVLAAQLRQSKYADLLSLHRFITQAGVVPNVITYNLILQTYLDCGRPDAAMEHFKQMINNAPFNPSPSTFRILVKGLVDNNRLEMAMELKEELRVKGLAPDPIVYHYLMVGCVRNSDADGVFKHFEELKGNLGGVVEDGVVYGNLIYGYFMRGMEEEAIKCYEEAVGENSKLKMTALAYNSVLNALSKNGKFDEALNLFDRMIKEHNPPMRLAVNLGSFNVMADVYSAQGRFKDAIEVFRKMGDYRCSPDILSFNNLIQQLCNNGLLLEAEELYGEMGEKGVSADEFTYVLLMDTCFKENRPDDAITYFRKMVESGLRPNLAVYNRLVDELVKVRRIDEVKLFFDLMVKKLKMDDSSYKFIVKVLSEEGRLDEMLNVVETLLDDDGLEFSEELQEFVKEELRKEGREEELLKIMEEKERQKAEAKAKEVEAAEAAKGSTRAILSLLPSKLFGNKGAEEESTENAVDSTALSGASEKYSDMDSKGDVTNDQIKVNV